MTSAKDNGDDGLWDDSALINAFNDAISKYKKMHGLGCNISSVDAEEITNCKQNLSDTLDARSNAEIASSTKTEMGDVANASTQKEMSCLESEGPENHFGSSDGQHTQHETIEYLNSQSPEDYNQLLSKYYELEDQRQKILQQLNCFGYWNYNSGYGAVTSTQHSTFASQAHPTITGSVCPFGCQSWMAPCTSATSCCFNEGCVRNSCHTPVEAAYSKNPGSFEETDFVKTAKVAAETALSSLKEQSLDNSDVSASAGKEKQADVNIDHVAKSTSSGTDLSVVLNAWYSAGFYTGKYLSEQSFTKNKHG